MTGGREGDDLLSQDREGFHKLIQSIDNIGLTSEEKLNLFRITAAVLHLGNIQFEEETLGRKGIRYCVDI